MDAAWALVTEHGLRAVTMSQIAARAGIGRATLYKYFPDVEAILLAWHQRHVAAHLAELHELAARPAGPRQRLETVLEAYARISLHRGRHAVELDTLLHDREDVAQSQRRVRAMVESLVAAASEAGDVRDDVSPRRLASFAVHALAAAAELASEEPLGRLVALTMDALRARPDPDRSAAGGTAS